jgi:hypothetical protein
MFDTNILNTECVNTGNKVPNMKIEGNIKIKDTTVFKYSTTQKFLCPPCYHHIQHNIKSYAGDVISKGIKMQQIS